MSDLGTHRLIAKLPQLGPLIGSTTGTRARLWARADDSYSGRAVLGLTVLVRGGALQLDSVEFWGILPTRLGDTEPMAVQRFALADVELPKAEDERVRMVILHVEHKNPDRLPRAYGWARNFDPLAVAAMKSGNLPGPAPVRYREFAPGKPLRDFVTELFSDLEKELAADRATGSAPLPRTYSRLRRRVAWMSQCEVRPHAFAERLPLQFAAGCCRHPGVGFDRELADRAFAALAARLGNDTQLGLVFMLGDQIYADATAGVLDVDERLEKYATCYETAFASDGFRRLTLQVPSYMVGDDHEIRDNWPNDALPAAAGSNYWTPSVQWAWELYFAHQRSHGPAPELTAGLSRPTDPRSFWYEFAKARVPFFAFDSRFERRPQGNSIVGGGQMAAFKGWLAAVSKAESAGGLERHVPKFVVSGSVFAPGLKEFATDRGRARQADNWQAFPIDRARVARLIAKSGAENVVFLSGDYHCAAIGSLRFHGGKAPHAGLQGYAIVAPPFYAPFPFANLRKRDVAVNESIDDPAFAGARATCEAKALEMHGFALVCVQRLVDPPSQPEHWKITVEFCEDRWAPDGSATAENIKTGLLANGKAIWISPKPCPRRR